MSKRMITGMATITIIITRIATYITAKGPLA